MYLAKIIKRKIGFEIRRLSALIRYPFVQDKLVRRLSSALREITIETTNICNANCVFCAYQFQERPTGFMTSELFQRIIDEFSSMGGGNLNLTPTVGDPLVDPNILDRIRYARSKNNIPTVGMYSNMILLKRVDASKLIQSGLTHLVVSMSGFDPKMYERVYRSKHYEDVFQNALEFATKNTASGNPVDFRIDMRVDRPLKEVFNSADLHRVADIIGIDHIGVKFLYDNWAGKISQDQLSGNMRLRHPQPLLMPRISPCIQLYRGPIIFWDGKVGGCGCRDVDAKELIIGDLNHQTLNEIWFGQELQKLRDEFMTPKIRPICQKCTHYNNLSIELM